MMEDQNCNQDFQEIYQENRSTEDMLFDQIIMEMQQIMINVEFQNTLAAFMKNNWTLFDQQCSQQSLNQIHEQFSNNVKNYLQNNIRIKVADFEWTKFNVLFKTRKEMVDEQILDTLLSLQDVQHFKSFIKDFKNSFQEEEMHKVLTIKSNKLNQSKKVKGKDNIFNNNGNDLFPKSLQAPQNLQKRKSAKQKTQQELLVPNLILTVKGLRKS